MQTLRRRPPALSSARGVVRQPEQIVGADAVVVGKLDDRPHGNLSFAALVAAVHAAVHIEHIRDLLLRLVVVLAQVTQSFGIHKQSPATMLPNGNIISGNCVQTEPFVV